MIFVELSWEKSGVLGIEQLRTLSTERFTEICREFANRELISPYDNFCLIHHPMTLVST